MMKNISRKILLEIKNNKNITEKELAKKFNYSERQIRRFIKELRDKQKIKMEGFGKKKIWKIL